MLSSTVQILEYEKLPKQPPAFLRYVRQSDDILHILPATADARSTLPNLG